MEKTIIQLNLVVKMAVAAWDSQNKQLVKLIDSLTDEDFQKKMEEK